MPREIERHSVAISANEGSGGVDDKLHQLTRNLLRQYDKLNELVVRWASDNQRFQLTSDIILKLHYFAMESILPDAGHYRENGVVVSASRHRPPPAQEVPELVESMCEYVRANWSEKSALHLASYCLWRLNWIHPFSEGNGVTARAVSYLVLSVRLGIVLPGTLTIPEQIVASKAEYYRALEKADAALDRQGVADVSEIETLLERMLFRQLKSV